MTKEKKIIVHLPPGPDRTYPIIFGKSLLQVAADLKKNHDRDPIFVLTDSNVFRFYGRSFTSMLRHRSAPSHLLVIPAGEKSKTRTVRDFIEDTLLKHHATRNSILIAFGGGMVGDIGGFVASTFLRGIDYIQIPTSLLAQVDSSVGGKVAINHPSGKNLLGAFYQPKCVYTVVSLLKTLPDPEYSSGLAEVIKYGAILDKSLFSFLERNRRRVFAHDYNTLTHIIQRCCRLKKSIVEKDEREGGLRRILNFGHTIGHAVEQLSAYKLRHGESIAVGMVIEAGLAVRLGILPENERVRLTNLIRSYRLPTEIPARMRIPRIIDATFSDKKSVGGEVKYTLMKSIGEGIPGIALSRSEVAKYLAR